MNSRRIRGGTLNRNYDKMQSLETDSKQCPEQDIASKESTNWVEKLRLRYLAAATFVVILLLATALTRELQRAELDRFFDAIKVHEPGSGISSVRATSSSYILGRLSGLKKMEYNLLIITVIVILASFVVIFEPVAQLLNARWKQLQDARSEANMARLLAEQASAYKSQFLANMSHEIRTPMNGVLGLTEEVLRTDLAPSQRELLTMTLDSARNLLTLLNDILDYSKFQAGKLELDSRPTDLQRVVEMAVGPFRDFAARKNNQLTVQIDDDVPRTVLVDGGRLRQILANLVSNACKFTESGSIDVRLKRLDDATSGRNQIEFSVSDTGVGIPAAKQKVIFLDFEQADNSISRHFGGTGLGLAISKQLVSRMEGNIVLASAVGEGSRFSFVLELEQSDSPAVDESQPIRTSDCLRVLVADDGTANQKVAELMLARLGHTVTSVANGEEAIRAILNPASLPFDLVLMDVQMPVLSGLDACRRIRQHENPEIAGIPILAVTASVMKEEREECIQAGMNDVIAKPVEFDKLSRAIQCHTGHHHPSQQQTLQTASESMKSR